jgi:hypothetical protein
MHEVGNTSANSMASHVQSSPSVVSNSGNGANLSTDDDIDDLTTIIPPPMIVIKNENAEQVNYCFDDLVTIILMIASIDT